MRFFTLIVFAALLSIASANYLVHLKYENGLVTQEAVYETNASAPSETFGAYDVSVGSYSAKFSFPVWVIHDPQNLFDENGNQVKIPKADEVITQETVAEALVVVPSAPPGSKLKVSNNGTVLLEEELKSPVSVEVVGKSSEGGCGSAFIIAGILLAGAYIRSVRSTL